MKEEIVDSLAEFTNVISSISSEGYSFFRGQSSHVLHKLLPSLLRYDNEGNRFYSNKCDKSFINSFKSKSIPYLRNLPRNDWEWLLTAQHYGIPTRLLDWSQSALVSLFFAVEDEFFDYEEHDDNPVVWCLNPLLLNSKGPFMRGNGEVPSLMENDEYLHRSLEEYYLLGKEHEESIYPLSIVGPRSNTRIDAQRGVFTLFPLKAVPLEDMDNVNEFLLKININKNRIYEIKKQLFELGITYSTIYPELTSISKDILFEYSI